MRYFQHLNPQDPDFQKVTTLKEIDDTNPDFVLYYFEDGSKCNKDFIGKINEKNVYGSKEFTEVSHPNNAWQFEITEIKRQKRYATNANGDRVEIADILDRGEHPIQEGKKISIKKTPEFVVINEQGEASNDFDFNQVNKHVDLSTNAPAKIVTKEKERAEVDKNSVISFEHNNEVVSLTVNDLIDYYNKEPEVKIVEKIIEKEVPVIQNDVIPIDIDADKKALIENMINMSQKDNCDIEMEFTLSLPPASVYNLIKSVYPKGMANAFVSIIANNMDIKELKTSVAHGLISYYDNDAEVSINNENSTL